MRFGLQFLNKLKTELFAKMLNVCTDEEDAVKKQKYAEDGSLGWR